VSAPRRPVHRFAAAATLASVALAVLGPLNELVPAYLGIHIAWLIGLLLVARHRPRVSAFGILAWALAMRLPLLVGPPPSLSDDVHRYVWEGRVVASGGDPWDTAPDDPSLVGLRAQAPEWSSINHRDLPAIYPPGAQAVFAALVGRGYDRIEHMRAAMVGFDLLLIALLIALLRARGAPIGLAILYAWNPLAVVEVASSGHYEPLALIPVVGGLLLWERRRSEAFLLWGLAFATKLVGVAPAWFAARRLQRSGRPRFAVLALAVAGLAALLPWVPFAVDGSPPIGSLGTYVEHWGHNASVHAMLTPWLGYHPARKVVGVLLLVWAAGLTVAAPRPAEGFALLFVGLVVLSPVVHPWYGLWLLVFLPLFPRLDLALLTGLLPLSYLAWTAEQNGGPWAVPTAALWLEYGLPAAASLGWVAVRRRPWPL
jgi:alpha-1,6-mannosyltransferase